MLLVNCQFGYSTKNITIVSLGCMYINKMQHNFTVWRSKDASDCTDQVVCRIEMSNCDMCA